MAIQAPDGRHICYCLHNVLQIALLAPLWLEKSNPSTCICLKSIERLLYVCHMFNAKFKGHGFIKIVLE